MIKLKVVLFILMILVSRSVLSQCATGVDTGGGACIPPDAPGMPDYQPPPNPQRQVQPAWVDQWGAFAVDEKTGQAGSVEDQPSQRKANEMALADCGMHGSSNCQVLLSFHNQCGVVVQGELVAYARGPDQRETEKNALAHCGTSRSCKIVYSACSYPKRIR